MPKYIISIAEWIVLSTLCRNNSSRYEIREWYYNFIYHLVLIDHEGLVKIIDFGVSKQLDLENQLAYDQRSSLQSMRGTTNWMAPEMIVASQGYSAKIDIWSFGCLVLEMLSGKRPWQQYSEAQVFRQLGKHNTPTLPRDISKSAASLLSLCFLM